MTERRQQDMEYDANMFCERSWSDKHHWVPRRAGYSTAGQAPIQVQKCQHCGLQYDANKHNPPEGYEPLEGYTRP